MCQQWKNAGKIQDKKKNVANLHLNCCLSFLEVAFGVALFFSPGGCYLLRTLYCEVWFVQILPCLWFSSDTLSEVRYDIVLK